MTNLRGWKQQHNKAIEKMRSLSELMTKEKREFKPDELKEYRSLEKEAGSLKEKIEREHRFMSLKLEAEPQQEISKKEQRAYSFGQAIKCLLAKHAGKMIPGCYEKEVSEELEKRNIHPGGHNGGTPFLIPTTELYPSLKKETRQLTSTSTQLISDPLKADEYLSALYEKNLSNRLGLKKSQAVGKFNFPKSGGVTSAWFAGDGSDSIAESLPTYTSLEVSPKFLGSYAGWTLKLLKEMSANLSLEKILRQDLSSSMSEELDKAIVLGSGTANQPSGIVTSATKETSKDRSGATAWSLAEVLGIVEDLRRDYKNNDMGLKWLISTKVWAEWASTASFAGASKSLLDSAKEVGEVIVTNHLNQADPATVATGTVEGVLGQWNDLMLTMFDAGIELELARINDDATKRITRLIATGCFDITMRRDEAFRKIKVDRKS